MIREIYIFGVALLLTLIMSAAGAGSLMAGEKSGRTGGGYIMVLGESNVNSFSLEYNMPEGRLPARCAECEGNGTRGNGDGEARNRITIPVKAFRAANRMMYSDFLDMMKESEYPGMELALPCYLPLKGREKGDTLLLENVIITIAGVSRQYDLKSVVTTVGETGVVLKGEKRVLITDFNIDPPTKTFGLIRVKEEIIVKFEFEFEL